MKGICSKLIHIQSGSGGKVNIFGGDSIGHCEKKKYHMNMYLTLNGYQNRAVWISIPTSVRFLFVGLDEKPIYERKMDT
jgi:hypothetical protein